MESQQHHDHIEQFPLAIPLICQTGINLKHFSVDQDALLAFSRLAAPMVTAPTSSYVCRYKSTSSICPHMKLSGTNQSHSLNMSLQFNTCCAEGQRPQGLESFEGNINYLGKFAAGRADS